MWYAGCPEIMALLRSRNSKNNPQQHKTKKVIKLCKFKTGIYLSFLLNRLCCCHIAVIL